VVRANGRPAQQVVEVAGGHGLQQLGGDRQAALDHAQHQATGQGDAGVHVVAAIQVRVVGQAFPAHRGARFFNVGAHHQQQLVADFMVERRQAVGVFQRRARVMDRAGADDHQQAFVAAFEDGADGLAVGMDLLGVRSTAASAA
jgi:cobaltochelatase CobN